MSNVLTKIKKVDGSNTMATSFEYNNVYQLTKQVEDTANIQITTSRLYDAIHRLTKVTDSNNNSTSYEFDQENRITKTTYADSGTVSMFYDLEGKITKRTDQNADDCTYLYNSRHLLTKKTYGISGVQTFAYDSMMRITSESDDNQGTLAVVCDYTYDKLSRKLTEAKTIGGATTRTTQCLYDTFGHKTKCIYPNGREVTYTYNSLHQAELVKSDVAGDSTPETIADYDYLYDSGSDKRPLLSAMTYESGTNAKVSFSYDEVGRATQKSWVTVSGTATTLVGFEHTYDLYGNRLTDNYLHNSTDSETYLYDTAQRFTKYERGTIGGSPSFTQAYTLDDIGNWSSFNNNGVTESRSHSVTNELTVQGTHSLSLDANGNSLDSKTHQYVWDELNRLIEVKDNLGVSIVAYYYDVHNLRVKKDFGTPEFRYYYCGGRVIEERDESEALLSEYIYGQQYIDEVLTFVDHSGTPSYLYYLNDLRFSVYAMVDALGNMIERYKYNGYGERIVMNSSYSVQSSSSINQEYSYTGRRLDFETGLMYFRARYFDNDQGRFINRDPLGYVDGMGLYNGYFAPRGLDPSGLGVNSSLDLNDFLPPPPDPFPAPIPPPNPAPAPAPASFAPCDPYYYDSLILTFLNPNSPIGPQLPPCDFPEDPEVWFFEFISMTSSDLWDEFTPIDEAQGVIADPYDPWNWVDLITELPNPLKKIKRGLDRTKDFFKKTKKKYPSGSGSGGKKKCGQNPECYAMYNLYCDNPNYSGPNMSVCGLCLSKCLQDGVWPNRVGAGPCH